MTPARPAGGVAPAPGSGKADGDARVGCQWLSSRPDGSAAIAAVAGALVGGAVAGGVAVASTSGNSNSRPARPAPDSSVATAAGGADHLSHTVQVGGSIGYDGSYTIAAPSGSSAQQVDQAQQAVTGDQQTLSADEQAESDAVDRRQPGDRGRPDQRRQPTSPPCSSDQAKRPRTAPGGGRPRRHAARTPRRSARTRHQLTQANQQLATAELTATRDHDQNQAKVASDQTKLQG